MLNVLEKVKEEAESRPEYPDEGIASNIYYISLSTALRSLEGISDGKQKSGKQQDNDWLKRESLKIQKIPVLDMDNIKNAVDSNRRSCDGLLYNFTSEENELHYMIEMKNTGKKDLLFLMESLKDDGILHKVKDSVNLIKYELEFGGTQEKETLIHNTHFFMVYGGKNDIPTQSGAIKLPQRTRVQRGQHQNKQKKAGKMDYYSQKDEERIYSKFGEAISKFGLKECEASNFPGSALPSAMKVGKRRIRKFSIFSARDFAHIVDNGFFDNWSWGEYPQYVNLVEGETE